MQKLHRNVEDQLYDGVVVMDIDRLGRRENKDWALIKDTFLNSETVIITPNKIYDLEIDNDDVSFDFMSIFARIEYKTIKRRMKQGKEAGAKKGMCTNGKPPFPYYYDKNTRSVLVDETKRPIYRAIVEKYLNGTNLGHIAIWLTDNKIPTPYYIKPDGKKQGLVKYYGSTVACKARSIWVTSLMVKAVPNVVSWKRFPKKSGLKSWKLMKS
ncbi:recombinase family protein [Paenibacillus solani]|nr:recombinase family protein [Paenibacillus solani]